MDMSLDKAEAALVAKELRTLLEEAVPLSCALPKVTLPNYDNVPGNLMLSALGLRLGDRVLLDGQKVRDWGKVGRAGLHASELGPWTECRPSPLATHPPNHSHSCSVSASFVPHPGLSSRSREVRQICHLTGTAQNSHGCHQEAQAE